MKPIESLGLKYNWNTKKKYKRTNYYQGWQIVLSFVVIQPLKVYVAFFLLV